MRIALTIVSLSTIYSVSHAANLRSSTIADNAEARDLSRSPGYCTYAPDESCYHSGWPHCCTTKHPERNCPREQPKCEVQPRTALEGVTNALDEFVGNCVTTYPPGNETMVSCNSPEQSATLIVMGRDKYAEPNYLYVCNNLLGGSPHCNVNFFTRYESEREWVKDSLDTDNSDVDDSIYRGVIKALNFWFDDKCQSNKQYTPDIIKTTCSSGGTTLIFRSTGIKYPTPNYIETCQNLLGGPGQDCEFFYYGAGEDPKFFVQQAFNN